MINVLANIVWHRVRTSTAALNLRAHGDGPPSRCAPQEGTSVARATQIRDRAPPALESFHPWPASITESLLTHFAELAGRCVGSINSEEAGHDDQDSELPP
jgi:hypothetical protein